MHADRLRQPLQRLRRALAPPDGGGLSDAQLLERFLRSREEEAFAALVRRHGPMVLGVCRRLLRHQQDAEDCFQAAFLVLAQRAGSVRKRASLASWLYGVAYRVALRGRCAAARRRSRERQVDEMPHPEVPPPAPRDWRPLLDEELNALPEKYRSAVVLCDLEGKARKEAARLLRVPEGTLSARLARARARLAGRLSKRGVTLSGGALAASLAGGAATAAVPVRLVVSTAKVAALVAAGQSAGVGSHAALLMHEVQRGMLMVKLKVCAALAAVTVLLGAGGLAYKAAGQTAGQDRPRPAKSAEVREPADMELLRKEVELLKLQVELLQQKVRAQGAELRELRGQAGRGAPRAGQPAATNPFGAAGNNTGPRTAPAPQGAPGTPTPACPPGSTSALAPSAAPASALPALTPSSPAPLAPAAGAPGLAASAAAAAPALPTLSPAGAPGAAPAATTRLDPLSQAEAALKALRQARDPAARRRATDALERALQRLRGQPATTATPDRPAQP
jgi:RNA polymerase sigma factor (sigma-70 family)